MWVAIMHWMFIGHYVLRGQLPLPSYILLLSGRISFELVQKSIMAGIKIVCGIGAPSDLAIDTAHEMDRHWLIS